MLLPIPGKKGKEEAASKPVTRRGTGRLTAACALLVAANGARHAAEVLMKAAALRSFLVMLFLVVTPAMAKQKLFFSCTNGRDPQTNAFVSDPNLILIVESEAKGFGVNEDSRDFDHLNDRKITVIAGAKLDQEPAATTKLIVDRFGGHLSLVITLDNCEGDHQDSRKGFALRVLYMIVLFCG